MGGPFSAEGLGSSWTAAAVLLDAAKSLHRWTASGVYRSLAQALQMFAAEHPRSRTTREFTEAVGEAAAGLLEWAHGKGYEEDPAVLVAAMAQAIALLDGTTEVTG